MSLISWARKEYIQAYGAFPPLHLGYVARLHKVDSGKMRNQCHYLFCTNSDLRNLLLNLKENKRRPAKYTICFSNPEVLLRNLSCLDIITFAPDAWEVAYRGFYNRTLDAETWDNLHNLMAMTALRYYRRQAKTPVDRDHEMRVPLSIENASYLMNLMTKKICVDPQPGGWKSPAASEPKQSVSELASRCFGKPVMNELILEALDSIQNDYWLYGNLEGDPNANIPNFLYTVDPENRGAVYDTYHTPLAGFDLSHLLSERYQTVREWRQCILNECKKIFRSLYVDAQKYLPYNTPASCMSCFGFSYANAAWYRNLLDYDSIDLRKRDLWIREGVFDRIDTTDFGFPDEFSGESRGPLALLASYYHSIAHHDASFLVTRIRVKRNESMEEFQRRTGCGDLRKFAIYLQFIPVFDTTYGPKQRMYIPGREIEYEDGSRDIYLSWRFHSDLRPLTFDDPIVIGDDLFQLYTNMFNEELQGKLERPRNVDCEWITGPYSMRSFMAVVDTIMLRMRREDRIDQFLHRFFEQLRAVTSPTRYCTMICMLVDCAVSRILWVHVDTLLERIHSQRLPKPPPTTLTPFVDHEDGLPGVYTELLANPPRFEFGVGDILIRRRLPTPSDETNPDGVYTVKVDLTEGGVSSLDGDYLFVAFLFLEDRLLGSTSFCKYKWESRDQLHVCTKFPAIWFHRFDLRKMALHIELTPLGEVEQPALRFIVNGGDFSFAYGIVKEKQGYCSTSDALEFTVTGVVRRDNGDCAFSPEVPNCFQLVEDFTLPNDVRVDLPSFAKFKTSKPERTAKPAKQMKIRDVPSSGPSLFMGGTNEEQNVTPRTNDGGHFTMTEAPSNPITDTTTATQPCLFGGNPPSLFGSNLTQPVLFGLFGSNPAPPPQPSIYGRIDPQPSLFGSNPAPPPQPSLFGVHAPGSMFNSMERRLQMGLSEWIPNVGFVLEPPQQPPCNSTNDSKTKVRPPPLANGSSAMFGGVPEQKETCVTPLLFGGSDPAVPAPAAPPPAPAPPLVQQPPVKPGTFFKYCRRSEDSSGSEQNDDECSESHECSGSGSECSS